MNDLNEMTPAELARVQDAIRAQQPVQMRRLSDGRIVTVGPDRVDERLTSGLYQLAGEQQ